MLLLAHGPAAIHMYALLARVLLHARCHCMLACSGTSDMFGMPSHMVALCDAFCHHLWFSILRATLFAHASRVLMLVICDLVCRVCCFSMCCYYCMHPQLADVLWRAEQRYAAWLCTFFSSSNAADFAVTANLQAWSLKAGQSLPI